MVMSCTCFSIRLSDLPRQISRVTTPSLPYLSAAITTTVTAAPFSLTPP
jgi:hypothetical protein